MAAPLSFNRIIDVVTHLFAELESQALNESELVELTMRQVLYLETIARMESPTFSELARQLDVSKPSVTAAVTKLMEKGYVKKVQSAEDRRSFTILLTEKGRALSQMHDQLHRRIAEHFTRALNETEQQQLVQLMAKVIQAG
jgi:DNA-binding MarR family transcriptional regulator